MDIELIVQTPSARLDVSELAQAITFTDNINKCGSLDFTLPIRADLKIEEGAAVLFKAAGEPFFLGYIFKISDSGASETCAYTAYDQLRYLTASDSYAWENPTATEIVQRICWDFGLKTGTLQYTGYPLGQVIEDNKALLDMIVRALDFTLAKTGNMFYVKDIAGQITLRSIASSIVNVAVAEGENLIDYAHERSIDTDTFNQIKLARDNKETGQREIYMTRDSSTIRKWGLLQHYELLDENMNEAQAAEQADLLLRVKNRPTRKFLADVIGDKNIRAGHLIYVNVPKSSLFGFLLCLSVKHSFASNFHSVNAEFRLV
jgi:hypothetical protein